MNVVSGFLPDHRNQSGQILGERIGSLSVFLRITLPNRHMINGTPKHSQPFLLPSLFALSPLYKYIHVPGWSGLSQEVCFCLLYDLVCFKHRNWCCGLARGDVVL